MEPPLQGVVVSELIVSMFETEYWRLLEKGRLLVWSAHWNEGAYSTGALITKTNSRMGALFREGAFIGRNALSRIITVSIHPPLITSLLNLV